MTTTISGQCYIKYCPEFNVLTGSQNASIILDRLEYWFARYKEGFYKFIEPCEHPLYKKGDSWSEEVGIARKTFNRAFALIGVRYISKSAFNKAVDPFQGKLYASYYDRKNNKTYFVRNHDMVVKFFEKLKSQKTACKSTNTENQNILQSEDPDRGRESIIKKDRSCNGYYVQSFIEEQKDTSNTPHIPPSAKADVGKGVDNLVDIWNGYVLSTQQVSNVSSRLNKRLARVFLINFDSNIKHWRNFCREVSNNEFLCGKTSKINWIATLDWISRSRNLEKLLQGNYGFNAEKIAQANSPNNYDVESEIDSVELDPGVKKLRKELLQEIGVSSYRSWFEKVAISWCTDTKTPIIYAPTQFWRDYVERTFPQLANLSIQLVLDKGS